MILLIFFGKDGLLDLGPWACPTLLLFFFDNKETHSPWREHL